MEKDKKTLIFTPKPLSYQWSMEDATWRWTFIHAVGWICTPIMLVVSRLLKKRITWQ